MGALAPLKTLVAMDETQEKFREVLKERAPTFLASVVSAVSTNNALQKCDPKSVLGAAMIAATLNLPINPNIGYSYIIPYKGKGQFQIGYKGFIQLAMRTGEYKTMHVSEVYEDELESYNPLTSQVYFTNPSTWKMRDEGNTENIIGYFGYFELKNGYTKMLYKSKGEILAHANQYSQSFSRYKTGLWVDNFVAMAKKTVLKELLSRWGVMSVQVERAVTYDYSTIQFGREDDPEYMDNPKELEEPKEMDAKEMAGEIFDDVDTEGSTEEKTE